LRRFFSCCQNTAPSQNQEILSAKDPSQYQSFVAATGLLLLPLFQRFTRLGGQAVSTFGLTGIRKFVER